MNVELESLLSVIREVHATHADDLCWMDIDRIFVAAGLPIPDRTVGDKEAMKANCARFIDQMCAGGKWKSYAELEAENQRLKTEPDGLAMPVVRLTNLSSTEFLKRVQELEQECCRMKDLLWSRGQMVAAAQMRDAEDGLHKTVSCWNHKIEW